MKVSDSEPKSVRHYSMWYIPGTSKISFPGDTYVGSSVDEVEGQQKQLDDFKQSLKAMENKICVLDSSAGTSPLLREGHYPDTAITKNK